MGAKESHTTGFVTRSILAQEGTPLEHTEYVIQCRCLPRVWEVRVRYSRFAEFLQDLKAAGVDPDTLPPLPGKHLFTSS